MTAQQRNAVERAADQTGLVISIVVASVLTVASTVFLVPFTS